MKKIYSNICLFAFACTLFTIAESCNNTNVKSYAASLSSVQGQKLLAKNDLQFLYNAVNLSTYNIQIANEALIRSTATETNTLAENLISSSAKIKNALLNIAAKYNINLPLDITAEQKRNWTQLVKQKGWEFDKAFATIVDANIENANNLFTNAKSNCSDRSLKDVATNGLMEQENIKSFSIAQENKIKERTGLVDETVNDDGAVADLIKVKTK